MVKIKFFGILKPCLPTPEEDGYWHADRAGRTIGEILEETGAGDKAPTVVLLVNRIRKTPDYVLKDQDTLTVMPLMPGG